MVRPHHPFRHHHPFRPPMPFGPGMVKEMSQLVFLWNIAEKPDGVTGYELQKYYRVKQTSVYRLLKEMEQEGFISAHETISKGRAQKLYKITAKGKARLQELRGIWSSRIVFLSDVVPFERGAFPTRQEHFEHEFQLLIDECQEKEEIIAVVQRYIKHLSHRQRRLQKELLMIKEDIKLFEEFQEKVQQLKSFDREKIKQYLHDLIIKRGK